MPVLACLLLAAFLAGAPKDGHSAKKQRIIEVDRSPRDSWEYTLEKARRSCRKVYPGFGNPQLIESRSLGRRNRIRIMHFRCARSMRSSGGQSARARTRSPSRLPSRKVPPSTIIGGIERGVAAPSGAFYGGPGGAGEAASGSPGGGGSEAGDRETLTALREDLREVNANLGALRRALREEANVNLAAQVALRRELRRDMNERFILLIAFNLAMLIVLIVLIARREGGKP